MKNTTQGASEQTRLDAEKDKDLSVDSVVLAPVTSGDWEVGMYFVTLQDFVNQVFRNYVELGEAKFDHLDVDPDLADAGRSSRLKRFCVVRVTAAQARRLRQLLNTQGQTMQLYALVGDEVYPGSLVPKQASLFMDFMSATALLSPVALAEVRSGQADLHVARTGSAPLQDKLDAELTQLASASVKAEAGDPSEENEYDGEDDVE